MHPDGQRRGVFSFIKFCLIATYTGTFVLPASDGGRWPEGNYFFIDMAKQKKKLSPDQKAAKKKRQKEYMTIFVNGKQKRGKRPPTIDGMDADEFITRNADPIWLHQNEMWEYMDQTEDDDLYKRA